MYFSHTLLIENSWKWCKWASMYQWVCKWHWFQMCLVLFREVYSMSSLNIIEPGAFKMLTSLQNLWVELHTVPMQYVISTLPQSKSVISTLSQSNTVPKQYVISTLPQSKSVISTLSQSNMAFPPCRNAIWLLFDVPMQQDFCRMQKDFYLMQQASPQCNKTSSQCNKTSPEFFILTLFVLDRTLDGLRSIYGYNYSSNTIYTIGIPPNLLDGLSHLKEL